MKGNDTDIVRYCTHDHQVVWISHSYSLGFLTQKCLNFLGLGSHVFLGYKMEVAFEMILRLGYRMFIAPGPPPTFFAFGLDSFDSVPQLWPRDGYLGKIKITIYIYYQYTIKWETVLESRLNNWHGLSLATLTCPVRPSCQPLTRTPLPPTCQFLTPSLGYVFDYGWSSTPDRGNEGLAWYDLG